MNAQNPMAAYPGVKIAWWAMQALWYLGLIASVLTALIILAAMTGIANSSFEVPLSATSTAGLIDSDLYTDTGPVTVGIVRYENPVLQGPFGSFDLRIRLLVCLTLATVVMAFLGIIYYLRQFVATVKDARPFDTANSSRLRSIAMIVMITGPIFGVLQFIFSRNVIDLSSFASAGLHPTLDLHLVTVLLGLVILVIAAAFDAGIKMQKEQDLTV